MSFFLDYFWPFWTNPIFCLLFTFHSRSHLFLSHYIRTIISHYGRHRRVLLFLLCQFCQFCQFVQIRLFLFSQPHRYFYLIITYFLPYYYLLPIFNPYVFIFFCFALLHSFLDLLKNEKMYIYRKTSK